jgi:hypothetical protein
VLALLSVVVGGAVATGCGGPGGAGNHAATATTFSIDATTSAAMSTILDQANTAGLLAASGRGGEAATNCTTAWNRVRATVGEHDQTTVRTLDAALASLPAAVRARDATAAGDAAATTAAAVARYTRLYP